VFGGCNVVPSLTAAENAPVLAGCEGLLRGGGREGRGNKGRERKGRKIDGMNGRKHTEINVSLRPCCK